ncbi:uncharacterized protein LOC141825431 [Curcuma longa]|uniref:uncharacterized protein LOC141825431 n=1 Tax=Curcuma longa TaxID=136217 RepID=UPI003D9E482B
MEPEAMESDAAFLSGDDETAALDGDDLAVGVLARFQSSSNEDRQHLCSTVGAMAQALKDQGIPHTPVAYFGATISSLDRLSRNPASGSDRSLVDEDCSCGMRKWLNDYKQKRPGLKILQERIDEFIIAHEAQLEKERKEREAQAAEGGWTVVVHHKGRKKTTDPESGITVGSVAQAAVLDNMAKRKSKVAEDFYRFQKREARRSEIMMLQSKFEQDKKRIKQLRDARKFKPY